MREQIQEAIEKAIAELFDVKTTVELSRPDELFGDWTTNIALKLASQLKIAPNQIAEKVAAKLKTELDGVVAEISLKNNFINLRLGDKLLMDSATSAPNYRPVSYADQLVVVEYSDPNPFKVLHAGHFYTSVVGDTISSLLELAGASVKRVNFGGDVGLHVAKTLWALITSASKSAEFDVDSALAKVQQYEAKTLVEKANWLSECYIAGNQLYLEGNDELKAKIGDLNAQIYDLVSRQLHDSALAKIYWTTRSWSYAYFEAFYKQIEVTPFDKYYPESETVEIGLKVVNEQLAKGVFEKSDGAVIFSGEKYGLHARVFINSRGLATYETKDIGLIMCKWRDYKFDKSIIITGNDQAEYMRVVLKSLELIDPPLAKKSIHFSHGIVKLKGGVKMSSRLGNILRADSLLAITDKASNKQLGSANKATTLGAIKYVFLRQRLGADIAYDPVESVSLIGNSGPYLQYAHARARSLLKKLPKAANKPSQSNLQPAERALARKISLYPDALQKSVTELMPHHICNYIYELAQIFNSFYEHNRVQDDPRQAIRAQLVAAYADVLKTCLQVLHIDVPDSL